MYVHKKREGGGIFFTNSRFYSKDLSGFFLVFLTETENIFTYKSIVAVERF